DIVKEVQDGELLAGDITDETISAHLTTAGIPDPDLLIRTGGDFRISNFMLWQLSYAEIIITDHYWPDFSKQDFVDCVVRYQGRQRRFGLTAEQL
ncbi:MAG: undecaprenyl diphosphate synthase family protein, partial [Muribaculaceae bacterium]|nr:undecaprenyl diphosphate synthase family protein [Muribaculaceae bacterium]